MKLSQQTTNALPISLSYAGTITSSKEETRIYLNLPPAICIDLESALCQIRGLQFQRLHHRPLTKSCFGLHGVERYALESVLDLCELGLFGWLLGFLLVHDGNWGLSPSCFAVGGEGAVGVGWKAGSVARHCCCGLGGGDWNGVGEYVDGELLVVASWKVELSCFVDGCLRPTGKEKSVYIDSAYSRVSPSSSLRMRVCEINASHSLLDT